MRERVRLGAFARQGWHRLMLNEYFCFVSRASGGFLVFCAVVAVALGGFALVFLGVGYVSGTLSSCTYSADGAAIAAQNVDLEHC